MKILNRLSEKYKKLKLVQKIELITAMVLTLIFVVSLPIFAWFIFQNKMETLTKIKAPALINIRAGNKEDIKFFELSNIDMENVPACYVFCIKPDGNQYEIQLAHTTNIPLDYRLYRAESVSDPASEDDYDVDYLASDSRHYYYKKKDSDNTTPTIVDPLTMTTLNGDTTNNLHYGRTLALNNDSDGGYNCYSKTYDTGDTPQIYAVPLYSKTNTLTYEATDDYDFFILAVVFNGDNDDTNHAFYKWNKAENNKETDIIYISAYSTSAE